jgi:acetyl-CoA carboxylase biotin carboxyl carrier protein
MPSDEVLTTLDAARRSALRLLARLPEAPTALRVRAGGVDIEVDWGGPAPAHDGSASVEGPRQGPMRLGPDEAGHAVRSPTVGIFHAAEAEGPPLVAVGDVVERGQAIAVVRQMGLAIPVTADAAGTVVEALRTDGEPVQHDEPLFVLDVR